MATKIYIRYRETQHKKDRFASCVVSETINDLVEANLVLEYGEIHNNFIKDLVDNAKKGLDNWYVCELQQTNEPKTSSVILNDKPQSIIDSENEIKALNRKLKTLKAETNAIMDSTAKLIAKTEKVKISNDEKQRKIDKLNIDNINRIKSHYQVSQDIAEWVNTNWDLFMKTQQYFKHNPTSIRALYAKHTETKVEETPEVFKPIIDIKPVSEFITVLDYQVNPQLFKDYIIHLNQTNGIKDWQFDEFEKKRVILHQRLFQALDGDRLDRSNGDGRLKHNAIEDILIDVQRCACHGFVNNLGVCVECGSKVDIGVYLRNLELKIKKD